MERVALDTSFLIDLQREHAHPRRARGAIAFLRAHPDTVLTIPAIALGEYLEGFESPHGTTAQALVRGLEVLPADPRVALAYATASRALRGAGRLIGSNDLWIGVTALTFGLPIVTNNAEHFRRIDGLEVIDHGRL